MDIIKKIEAKCNFNPSPTVDILSDHSEFFLVEFYENIGSSDWALTHSWHEVKPFHYYKYNRHFRTKWRIKVWGWEENKPTLVYEHHYCEKNQNVGLVFEHFSLKVQKEWTKKAIAFKNKNGCKVIIESKFSEKLAQEFNEAGLVFAKKIENEDDLYAKYTIKKHEIQPTTANWWETDLIFENHSKAFKSWHIPIDWVEISNEEIFDVIIGNE